MVVRTSHRQTRVQVVVAGVGSIAVACQAQTRQAGDCFVSSGDVFVADVSSARDGCEGFTVDPFNGFDLAGLGCVQTIVGLGNGNFGQVGLVDDDLDLVCRKTGRVLVAAQATGVLVAIAVGVQVARAAVCAIQTAIQCIDDHRLGQRDLVVAALGTDGDGGAMEVVVGDEFGFDAGQQVGIGVSAVVCERIAIGLIQRGTDQVCGVDANFFTEQNLCRCRAAADAQMAGVIRHIGVCVLVGRTRNFQSSQTAIKVR